MEKVKHTKEIEDALKRVKEKRDVPQGRRRKENWIDHIIRKNCLLIDMRNNDSAAGS